MAAQTALLLRRQLTEALAGARDLPARRHRLAGLSGQAFQRALATDVLEPAWALAAGTDLRLKGLGLAVLTPCPGPRILCVWLAIHCRTAGAGV